MSENIRKTAKKVIFCYDIVCPYAYLASTRIEQAVIETISSSATLAYSPVVTPCDCSDSGSDCDSDCDSKSQMTGCSCACSCCTSTDSVSVCECHMDNQEHWTSSLEFRPVLLGGLYKNSKAPQGKDGSASDVMPTAKKALFGRDLLLSAHRLGVPLNMHPRHPVKSILAQRLLVSVTNESVRRRLTHDLYAAYWDRNEDIDQMHVLQQYARKHRVDWNETIASQPSIKQALFANTQYASDRGAFGVPAFFITNAHAPESDSDLDSAMLIWGQDRIHFVQQALGAKHPTQLRVVPVPRRIPNAPAMRPTVTFYFDFASPWSFLGFTQLHQIRAVANVKLAPVLVGALFRMVGTPNVPMLAMSPAKRTYSAADLQRWSQWWQEPLQWPSQFPIRTVLPLRVAVVEPRTCDAIFRAAWQQDQNIGVPAVLERVLNEAGFDGKRLLEQTTTAEVKQALKTNTETAVANGVIGVPSYQIPLAAAETQIGRDAAAAAADDDDESFAIIWGQDKLDIVLDLACGYEPVKRAAVKAKRTSNNITPSKL
jgi:2-hydroxychromene-2-carboxylate isomerase